MFRLEKGKPATFSSSLMLYTIVAVWWENRGEGGCKVREKGNGERERERVWGYTLIGGKKEKGVRGV